jgi:hypothetical protein
MSDNLPHTRDDDDATHDDAPPTDAVSDEVKADAAGAEPSDAPEETDADVPGLPDAPGTDEREPGTDASAPADAS